MNIYDKKYDLLVFGEPMVQYTIKSKNVANEKLENPSLGGEDVFVAATVAKLGYKCGFFSPIAKDPYEKLIKSELEKFNISAENCVSGVGFNGIEIVSDKDNELREFFYNRPAGFVDSVIQPNLNKELINQCRMIYASSAFTLSSPEARTLVFKSFLHAHYNNIFVAFDPNVRLHRHNLTQVRETIWMLMPFIDFFSISMASGEMEAIFDNNDPIDVALNLLEKNVRYVAIRNGCKNVLFAFRDENDGKRKYCEIPVQKVDNGYLSYSGAVFNGAFLSTFLQEATPLQAAQYATNYASEKCRKGNSLASIFSADA